jgi:hypothetical protein
MADSKRPGPGTGRIALGSMSVAASSVLAITALAGPGWLDLSRRESIIAGGLAIPLATARVASRAVRIRPSVGITRPRLR